MEVNKKKPPLLTLKDVEEILVEPSATRMDILAAITSIAQKVHNFQKIYNSPPTQQQETSPKNIYYSLTPKKSQKALSNDPIFDGVFTLWSYYEPFCCSDNSSRVMKKKFEKGKKRELVSEDEDEDDEDENEDDEDEDVNRRRPFKKKKRGVIYSKPIDQDYLPIDLKTLIIDTKKGTHLKLVIQKKLTESDARKGQNRFLMPLNQIQNKFLLDHEEESLKGCSQKGDKSAMVVKIIEPNNILKETSINLKRWEMKKSHGASATSVYVLNKTWYSILMNNGLGPDVTVQLWAFRVDGQLNFALVNVSGSESSRSSSPVSFQSMNSVD